MPVKNFTNFQITFPPHILESDLKMTRIMESGRNAKQIVSYILHRAEQLDPLQINKIAFFCHGWSVGVNRKPLISETIEAWRWGPVIPSIYQTFRMFGELPVTYNVFLKLENVNATSIDFSKEETAIMDPVIDYYSQYVGGVLIGITHEDGSPWQQCWVEGMNNPIPNNLIEEYYRNKLDEMTKIEQ